MVGTGVVYVDAEAADLAARELLRCWVTSDDPGWPWNNAAWLALKALHPDAAEHFRDSLDARATLEECWPDLYGRRRLRVACGEAARCAA